jgi:hypothetical protein
VAAEAERWLGAPLWLDPFATAVDALVPCFFWRFLEPLAEGADALARQVWGSSRCPECGALHRDCAFALPSRSLLPALVAKRRRGRTGCAASSSPRSRLPNRRGWRWLTMVAGQQDQCLILPYTATYASEGEEPGGA